MSRYSYTKPSPDARPEEQYRTALSAGIKGSAGGLAVFAPGAYFLHRTWQPFGRLTLPLKTMFVTMATISAGVIAADKAGIRYDQEHYSDAGARIVQRTRTRAEQQWDELSTRDKALTWTKDNKFGVVVGSWVLSMGGIFAYIQSQPMTFAQKLVQTRVWAQGITLASLLSMAALTQVPSAGDKILYERDHAADHSWRDFIKDDEGDDKDKEAAMKALSNNQSSKKVPKENRKTSS